MNNGFKPSANTALLMILSLMCLLAVIFIQIDDHPNYFTAFWLVSFFMQPIWLVLSTLLTGKQLHQHQQKDILQHEMIRDTYRILANLMGIWWIISLAVLITPLVEENKQFGDGVIQTIMNLVKVFKSFEKSEIVSLQLLIPGCLLFFVRFYCSLFWTLNMFMF
jgi:hypothetical protein